MPDMAFDFSAFPEEQKPATRKDMQFDFSAFPEEQKPASLKVMAFDFSFLHEDQNLASLKEMPFDFSAFPEQPKTESVPYAGEDQGSQLNSYNPDSWINDEIPAAPAHPLFTSVPRPPERLYRENAPQILQDIWNAASPEPTVGPLREHPLRPDVRQALWTLFKEQALPNEPTGIVENMEAGLRQASAHVAANVISLIGSPMDENGGPTRAEQYNSVYKAIYKAILPDNLAPPQDFADSLARGVGEAAPSLVEAMLLSYATGGALNPLFQGMAAKFPTLTARLFPIARDALTFGAQGVLEPEQAGTQAAIGTGVGAILGALSPYSPLARVIGGAGIGAGQEYLTNPTATAQDFARSATLMSTFAGLAAAHGLTMEEAIAGTFFDWAENKGYSPEEIKSAVQTQGLKPVLNEFAQDMTAPQMENRSGVIVGGRPGESGGVEQPTETSADMEKIGLQDANNVAMVSPEADKVGKEPVEPGQHQWGETDLGGSSEFEGDLQEAEEAAISESTPRLYKSLVRNLEAAGEPRPEGHVAHHTVAVRDPRAEPARTILQEFDITLHSADNGVWLPGIKEAEEGPYHPELHTGEYYDEVERRLKTATDREEVLGVLRKIKKELSENKFPY